MNIEYIYYKKNHCQGKYMYNDLNYLDFYSSLLQNPPKSLYPLLPFYLNDSYKLYILNRALRCCLLCLFFPNIVKGIMTSMVNGVKRFVSDIGVSNMVWCVNRSLTASHIHSHYSWEGKGRVKVIPTKGNCILITYWSLCWSACLI